MRVLGVVVVMFVTLAVAGCGERDEDLTEQAGGTGSSPTVETVTTTSPAATATSPAEASPQREITSRFFLRASGGAGQPPSTELVQAASDVVKKRLETFLETGVRISPDPAHPDLIVADIVTSGLTEAEMATVEGLMEIIDTQGTALGPGTVVSTTLGTSDGGGTVYETIVSSRDVSRSFVTTDQFGEEVVGFELGDEGVIGGLSGDEAVKLAIQLDGDPLPITLSLIGDPAE